MTHREINFDGLIGPSHNYSGLSQGNLASTTNGGLVSRPREAALQGLDKMQTLMGLGLAQGFLPPIARPAMDVLRSVGFTGSAEDILCAVAAEDPSLLSAACSASAMWAANAATVIAAPDSKDGRVHLVTANLASLLHRAIEAPDTLRTLQRIFRDPQFFSVHPPLPFGRHFGDEGAANHLRIATRHEDVGVNVFVHGEDMGGGYPARQTLRASCAVARLAGVRDALHIAQSRTAILAGVFHNDVAAVANENVLLVHADAFKDRSAFLDALMDRAPRLELLEVSSFGLDGAVRSYLFNSQLVSLPAGGMALVVPAETRADALVWAEVERLVAKSRHINQVVVVDVRQSMMNGGGPACLRLRVPVSDAALAGINPAYILDHRRVERLRSLIEQRWPKTLVSNDLQSSACWAELENAQAELEVMISADNW